MVTEWGLTVFVESHSFFGLRRDWAGLYMEAAWGDEQGAPLAPHHFTSYYSVDRGDDVALAVFARATSNTSFRLLFDAKSDYEYGSTDVLENESEFERVHPNGTRWSLTQQTRHEGYEYSAIRTGSFEPYAFCQPSAQRSLLGSADWAEAPKVTGVGLVVDGKITMRHLRAGWAISTFTLCGLNGPWSKSFTLQGASHDASSVQVLGLYQDPTYGGHYQFHQDGPSGSRLEFVYTHVGAARIGADLDHLNLGASLEAMFDLGAGQG
ncbi:MAG: hypothetical protein HYT80_10380 [Euryarchaeota archaeon]|nr:hypothetical protein [Euryarchaeota archaeon]